MRYSNNENKVALPYNYREWLAKGKKHQMAYIVLLYFFLYNVCGLCKLLNSHICQNVLSKVEIIIKYQMVLNYYIFFHRDMS